VPAEEKPVGKVVTNMGRGVRVEIRAPAAVVTPAMIDRLGEDSQIKRGDEHDWLIFWMRTLEQCDTRQLREVWGLCRPGTEAAAIKSKRARRSAIVEADAT